MKRHPALQSLSRDHHQTLLLALHCLRAADAGDPQVGSELCQQVAGLLPEWEEHFQAEEQVLFPCCTELGGEAARLARQLTDEHRQLRSLGAELAAGDSTRLQAFGQLLQDHTRMEERQLFPLLESELNEQILAGVARGLEQ